MNNTKLFVILGNQLFNPNKYINNAINKANRLGWNHHIERLMILANLMNLSEIKPLQVYN